MSRLLHSDDRTLVYGEGRGTRVFGLVFALVGAAAATPGWLTALGALGLGFFGWMLLVVGTLFVVIGIGVALYTNVLTLDTVQRTWSWKRGFAGRARTRRGTLDDFDAVGLHMEVRRRSSGSDRHTHEYTAWVVTLRLKGSAAGDGNRMELAASESYAASVGEMESVSARLGLRMIDESGDEPHERAAGTAERTIRQRAEEAAAQGEPSQLSRIPDLPSDSRARLDVVGAKIRLSLPVSASNNASHALTVLIIAGVAAGVASFFVLGLTVIWHDVLTATPVKTGAIVMFAIISLVGALFILGFYFVGLILLIEGLFSFKGVEHLEIQGDHVCWYRTLWGRRIWRKDHTLSLSGIKKITVLTEQRREQIVLVLKGDEHALAEHLGAGDRRWLAELLRALAEVPAG
ncbi:MAG: hypothetical protein ACYTGF_04885 [Planctomycetota bacterium]